MTELRKLYEKHMKAWRNRGDSLSAYYYSLEKTNVPEIDEILATVAFAGKMYHHTTDWEDNLWDEPISVVDMINEAARRAAEAWKANSGKPLPTPPQETDNG